MLNLINPIPFPPIIVVLAYLLDLMLGDPEGFPHPVRWIGRLISFLEKAMRGFLDTPGKERLGGAAFGITVVGITYGVSLSLLAVAYRFSYPSFFALSLYMVWTSISIRSLGSEAKAVVAALEKEGITAARKRLTRIVGRDTQNLSEEGVLKATVETVSENTSDGVIAPLFYLALGGPALMIACKAVNTLDSMVGYKNERYINFGRFSARLDDAMNYIPARLSGGLIVCTSFILRYNWRESSRILLRDGRNHPSPNSGLPEAAVAGALGLRLGGVSNYGGVACEKPYIGDGPSQVDTGAVASSISIMRFSAFLMVSLTLAFRMIVIFF